MANTKIRNPRSRILIGCQGWNYEDWTSKVGGETVFYPRGTRSPEMLQLYAQIFATVEVDSTFYAVPPASTIENWYLKTPENFSFSLKLPREITHERLLHEDSYDVLDEFCERIAGLKEKLAIVLVQLPPQFDASKENALRLRRFLSRLPKEIRFAVEFRERLWMVEWTLEELERHGAALCLVEGSWLPRAAVFEAVERLCADFAYVRFMGERDLTRFDRIYRREDAGLRLWKEQIERIKASEIYVYFSNFFEGHAPASAFRLQKLLGQDTAEVSSLENQRSLF